MFDLDFPCRFDSHQAKCHKDITNWVFYDHFLTWAANIVIALCLIVLVFLLGWYVFVYRRLPFCERCLQQGIRERAATKGKRNQALCEHHLIEENTEFAKASTQAQADSEPRYPCPKHGGEMEKVIVQLEEQFIVVDQCAHGCQFNEEGEAEKLQERARSLGYKSGYSDAQSAGGATVVLPLIIPM
jgi:hypothetical protein